MLPTPEEKSTLSRELFIIRGIAIVLVVAGHVIGYDKTFGMRLAYQSDLGVWGQACELINTFHMPVFFIASGIAFMVFSKKDSDVATFIRSKFTKLLIPLIVYAPIYFVLQHLVKREPFSASDVLLAFAGLARSDSGSLVPYEIFWFIHHLLFSTLLSYLCFKFLKSKALYLLISAALVAPYCIVQPTVLNWFDSLAYWNFFYAFGVLIAESMPRASTIASRVHRVALPELIVGCLLLMIYVVFYRDSAWVRFERFINGPIGFLMLWLLIQIGARMFSKAAWAEKISSGIAQLGAASLAIYLFHSYFTRGSAIIIQKLIGLPHPAVYFLIVTGCGVALPFLINKFLTPRSKWYVWSMGGGK